MLSVTRILSWIHTFLPCTDGDKKLTCPMESAYPKLTALVAEISKRPATVAALEAEGLPPVFDD